MRSSLGAAWASGIVLGILLGSLVGLVTYHNFVQAAYLVAEETTLQCDQPEKILASREINVIRFCDEGRYVYVAYGLAGVALEVEP